MKRTPLKRTGSLRKRKPISPASPEQREKVKDEGRCRVCKTHRLALSPAHIADRSLGGCDDPLCVIPLCTVGCHSAYDDGDLDLLPHLTRPEQAHAVLHLGLIGALRRTTNDREIAA